MADRLEEFQEFRAELNEEILGCGHLGMKRFLPWIIRPMSLGRSAGRTRNCWAWWHRRCCAATTALRIISRGAPRKAGSGTR